MAICFSTGIGLYWGCTSKRVFFWPLSMVSAVTGSISPLNLVNEFERSFLEFLERDYQMEVLDVLKSGVIDDNVCKKIEETAAKAAKQFM